MGYSQHGHLLPQSKGSETEREREKVIVFMEPKLGLEVASITFGHILSIRSGSLGPAHNQGKGLDKDTNSRRQGSLRAILEATCYSIPSVFLTATISVMSW